MATAKGAVAVLFLGTVGDAHARRGAAVTTVLVDADAALGTLARAGAGGDLRAVGVTTADCLAAQAGETVAVRVADANTVVQVAVGAGQTAIGAMFVAFGQGQTGDRGSGRYAGDSAAHAAKGCTAADFVIGQGFGYVLEPVCHRHLLVNCVGGICAVLQHPVPRRAEHASSIQK